MHFTWATDMDIFWQGQTPVLMWPYSGSSVVSNISIILVSLLQYGSPSPISTETPEQKSLPAHHPSNIIVLPPGLSLARLVLSHFPFKSSSKLFQWVLLTPVQRLFSQVHPICHHLAWCCVNWPTINIPSPSNSAIDIRLWAKCLSADSSWYFSHHFLQLEGWKRTLLCSWSLRSHLKISLDCPQASCNFIAAYLK